VVTASLLVEHVSVLDVRSNEVFLALSTPPMAKVFSQGNHADVLAEALTETFGGGAWRVTIGEPGASGGRPGAGGARGGPSRPAGPPAGYAPTADGPSRPTPPAPATAAWSGQQSGQQSGQGIRPPTGYAAQPQPSGGYGTSLGGGAQPPHPAGIAGGAGGFAGSAIATAERGPLGPGLGTAPGPTFARQDAGPGLAAAPATAAVTTVGGTVGGTGLAGGATMPSRATSAASVATAAPGAFETEAAGGANDEPSLDDEDAPTHPGATLSGEAAAVELLRVGLGATVMEQRGGD
jgi:DNA polymerase-3 subunit gamma/tau